MPTNQSIPTLNLFKYKFHDLIFPSNSEPFKAFPIFSKLIMATVNSVVLTPPEAFENLLNFVSSQPNFPAIYRGTVVLLKKSLKIPESPPISCEAAAFYITIHKENFLKSIFAKKKLVLVWLVSAFVLLTGKTLEDLVKLLFFSLFNHRCKE